MASNLKFWLVGNVQLPEYNLTVVEISGTSFEVKVANYFSLNNLLKVKNHSVAEIYRCLMRTNKKNLGKKCYKTVKHSACFCQNIIRHSSLKKNFNVWE